MSHIENTMPPLPETPPIATGSLAKRLCTVAAGCAVDGDVVRRRRIDLAALRKLGEAYRAGWLHNVMGRITPLTLRQSSDYEVMADLFVMTAEDAQRLLERYLQDLEIFCASVGIVSPKAPEVEAHINLYQSIGKIFSRKFDLDVAAPEISGTAVLAAEEVEMNPFLKEFVTTKFGKK